MPLRVDDPTVTDDALLWRRIQNQPGWVKALPDGSIRPSSVAFLDNYTNEVSVHLAELTKPENALQGRPDDGLTEIMTSCPRSLGHAIVRDPTEDDPSHALICPPTGTSKKKS